LWGKCIHFVSINIGFLKCVGNGVSFLKIISPIIIVYVFLILKYKLYFKKFCEKLSVKKINENNKILQNNKIMLGNHSFVGGCE